MVIEPNGEQVGSNTKHRLTIGMPVRNGERYLARALDCLLAQTFRDFRILISDNESTDQTRDIGERYAAMDPRVEYRRQGTNLGASGNFNHVFTATESELFKWAAHDDECEPEFLRKAFELLDRNADAVLAHSYTNEIDAAGAVTGVYEDQIGLLADRPSDRLAASFRIAYPSPVWGVMRREAVAKTRLMGPYLGSDWNFIGEMVLLGRVVLVPEYLFSVRNHESGFSFGMQKQSKQVRLAWFDPKGKKPIVSAFRSAAMFVEAALKHPMPVGERVACLTHIAARFGRKVPRAAGRLLPRVAGA
jgi:glycosyltransferase involved in cell wall biosynthesis